jgi:hypothetical protein
VRRRDDDTLAQLVGTAIAVGLVLGCMGVMGAYNAATCLRWDRRTETQTDCWSTGSGYHTCTSRPVEVAYCAERRP